MGGADGMYDADGGGIVGDFFRASGLEEVGSTIRDTVVTNARSLTRGISALNEAAGEGLVRAAPTMTNAMQNVAENAISTGQNVANAQIAKAAGPAGALGGHDQLMSAISVKLGGCGECVLGAYETLLANQVAGGSEDEKNELKMDNAVLQAYGQSTAARVKKTLVDALRKVAQTMLGNDGKNARDDEIFEVFLKKLPNPAEESGQFKANAKAHEALCKQLANAINTAFGQTIIPSTEPEVVCRQVLEILYSLQKGLQSEFLVVYNNTQRHLANLRALIDMLTELVNRAKANADKTEPGKAHDSAVEALNAMELVKNEATRQLEMLSASVVGALGASGSEIDTLLSRREKLYRLVEKLSPINPSSSGFSRTLAAAMQGVANTAQMAIAVHKALEKAGMKVKEYVDTKNGAELQAAIDRLTRVSGSDAAEIRKAGEVLLSYHGMRDKLTERGLEVSGAADTYPDNLKIKKNLERQGIVLTSIERSFVAKFDAAFQLFTATVEKLSKKMSVLGQSSAITATETLDHFRTALQGISTISMPNAIPAFIGYVVSPASDTLRNEFVTSVETAASAARALGQQPDFASLSGELNELAGTLDGLRQSIDMFRSEVRQTFVTPSVSAKGGDDMGTYSAIPPTALSQIERPLQLAMNKSGNLLKTSIERLDYFIELAYVRDDFRQAAELVGLNEEKITTVNAAAIGKKIVDIRTELENKLKTVFETAPAGAAHSVNTLLTTLSAPPNPMPARYVGVTQANAKETSERLKTATGKMLRNFYLAKVNLYRALESFDAYMRAFTGAVLKHPDALSDLEQLFSPARAARQWYGSRTGAQIASVFECFPVFTTENPATGAPFSAYSAAKPQELVAPNADHYYKFIRDTLARARVAPPGNGDATLPGNPYAAIPPTKVFSWNYGHDDAQKRVREVYGGLFILKNLVSAFFYIGDKFGNESLRAGTLLTPTQMYDYLQTYLEISAMTLRMPNPETKILYEGYPGGANSNANRCTARLVSLNRMAEQYRINRASPRANLVAAVQPWTDVGNANINDPMNLRTANTVNIYQANDTHTFAGVIAPAAVNAVGAPSWSRDGQGGAEFAAGAGVDARALAEITVAMSSVFPELGNMFADTDEYFYRILRGMAAKVMAVMGVHVMLERPDTAITMNPIRTVLGAAETATSAVEVIPGAAALYLYGTFALEFFKDLLGITNPVDQDLGAKIAMTPDFDGEFSTLLNLMFVEMRHQKALDGVYSDAQIAALIREFNKLYERHKSAGAQIARTAVYAIVKEINRRMSLLTSADIRRIEESITVRSNLGTDRDPDTQNPQNEDIDLLPDEGDRATRGLPSDSYAVSTGRVTTPDAAAAERYQLRSDDVQIFNRLRRKVDGKVLSDGTGRQQINAKPDDLRSFLREITRDIEEQIDNQKRFELVATVLRSRDYSFGSTSARTLIAFHEVVGAPLTVLNALLGYVNDFADQIAEHDALSFDNDLDEIFLKTPPAGGLAANWLFANVVYNAGGTHMQRHSVSAIIARLNQLRKDTNKPLIQLNGYKFSSTMHVTSYAMTYPNYDRLLAGAVPAAVKDALTAGPNNYSFPFGTTNMIAGAGLAGNAASAVIGEQNAPFTIDAAGDIAATGNDSGFWRPLEDSTLANRQNPQHFHHLYYESLKFVLLNREGLLRSMIETVAAFAGDNQGLVEVSTSDQQLFINYEKLQTLCSDLLQGIRTTFNSFQPLIPAGIAKTFLGSPANDQDGSLAAAELIFKKLFVKDERLPEAKSQMEITAQILSDNFSHAVRQHRFDIELGVAIAVGVARAAAGADPIAAQHADITKLLLATPSRFPYRFIMPALSFYPIRGPGATSAFLQTEALPVAANPSALHVSSTVLTEQPNNVWRLLGTVRTAAALATPIREYKNITLQRVNIIDNNSSIRETPFLAINQLILDALDAVYDETAEKIPRSIVQPFIEKMGGLISDEKNAFPDLISPAVAGGAAAVNAYIIARLNGRGNAGANPAMGANAVNKIRALVPSNGWVVGDRVDTEFSTHSGVSPLAPRANLVLCASLATVMRNAYYNNDTSGKRINVWESAEEIPEHIKERARAHLPRTRSALDTVRAKIKFLRAILGSNMAISGRALVEVAGANTEVDFYNTPPVTCWSATYGTGSSESLHAPVRGGNFDKSYFEELFRSLDGLASTAQQAITGVLETIGKPATFFEEFAGSSAVAMQFSGRKMQALPSALLLLTMRSLTFNEISKIGTANFKFAYGTSPLFLGKSPDMTHFPAVKSAAAQASALLPSGSQLSEATVSTAMTAFLRATRYLTEVNLVKRHLCAQSSFIRGHLAGYAGNQVDIGSSPFARLMLAKYNAAGLSLLPTTTRIGTAVIYNLSQAPTGLVTPGPFDSIVPKTLLGQQLDSAIHGMISDFYQPDDGFVGAANKYVRRNKYAKYHLPGSNVDGVRAAYSIMLAGRDATSGPEVSSDVIEKILSFLLSTRANVLNEIADYYHSTTPVVADRSALWIRTFLALRIVPIQPSILSRELPFATTYNWDYAFGDMVTRLMEKYDPDSVKRWRQNVPSGGVPQNGYTLASPTEALLVSLLDPNYPGINKETYGKFFVPMLLGDDSLPISRPKLLSDAMHNGALLGNTFARDVWPERYGRNTEGAVIVSPQSLHPSLWISNERRVAAAVDTFMRELETPTKTVGFLAGLLLCTTPITHNNLQPNDIPTKELDMTYTPLHNNFNDEINNWIRRNIFPKVRQHVTRIFSVIKGGGDVGAALAPALAARNRNGVAVDCPQSLVAEILAPAGRQKDARLAAFADEITALVVASATVGIMLQRDLRNNGAAPNMAFACAAAALAPANLNANPAIDTWEIIPTRRALVQGISPTVNGRDVLVIPHGVDALANAVDSLLEQHTAEVVQFVINAGAVGNYGFPQGNFAAVIARWESADYQIDMPPNSPNLWKQETKDVMTAVVNWANLYIADMNAGAFTFNGPLALCWNVARAENRLIGSNFTRNVAAAASSNVGFGILAPSVCSALMATSIDQYPNALYYPKNTDNSRVIRANLEEVQLGADANVIATAAYARTTTTFTRKLMFMTNLQRMLYHFIQTSANDLGKARVIRGLVVGDPRLTDFRANEAMEKQ